MNNKEVLKRFEDIWIEEALYPLADEFEIIKDFIEKKLQAKDEELKANISFLRQYLNEDKITDPNKLITNKEIESWLFDFDPFKSNLKQ